MRLLSKVVPAIALLLLGGSAFADQVFVTPSGSTNGGNPVAGSADFSFAGGTLTLTLTNTEVNLTDAGQLLTDISFTSSSALGTPGQSGSLISIDSGGNVTTVSGSVGWGFGSIGGTSYELCTICTGGVTTTTTPSHGIIGPAGPGDVYSNGNGSIDGNGPHNPFINQTAVFTFTGLSGDPTISNVVLSFGTTPGSGDIPTVSTPEPSTLSLLLSALLLLGFVALRKRESGSVMAA